MKCRRGAVAVTSAVAVLLGFPAVAAAATRTVSIDTGAGWTHDSSTPLFDGHRIVPGWSASSSVLVRNDADRPAGLTVATLAVADAENGCTHAETAVDSTCGASEGELSDELTITISVGTRHDGGYTWDPRWRGTVRELEHAAVVDTSLPAHVVRHLRIDAALPMSSGNEVQSDSVSFALRLGVAGNGADGSATVLGTKVGRGRPDVLNGVVGSLPFTGSDVGRGVWCAVALIGAGLALIGSGHSRRRRAQAPLNSERGLSAPD